MKAFLYVFIGGGLGSLFRFLTSKLIPVPKGMFPWTTLFVNYSGCLLIGFLMSNKRLKATKNPSKIL